MIHTTLPNYSVIMSVYKGTRNKYLIASLDSLCSQTILPQETIIIIDGIVSEEVLLTIKKYNKQLNIHSQKNSENMGLAYSMNKALNLVSSEYVARFDDDDVSVSNRFELQIKFLENHPNVHAVGGVVHEFKDNIGETGTFRRLPEKFLAIKKFAKYRSPINHPTVMMRLTSILGIKYSTRFNKLEDYYLWIKFIQNDYELANINKVLVHMRVSDQMYKRRGGINQAKEFYKFRRQLYSEKYLSFLEFVSISLVNMISSILPNKLRKLVYRILR